jgi:hypothetical protein
MLKSLQVCFFAILPMVIGVFPVLAGNNSGAAFTFWPDTGLTKCYDATLEMPCPAQGDDFYGQDSQHAGPARSYSLMWNGSIVQDNVTGLIWELKTDMDGIKDYTSIHDADNTYRWCDTNTDTNGGEEGTCGSNDTKTFIDQLNGENFGGRNNWRLPTVKELATLLDLGRVKPAIDPLIAITHSTSEASSNYWSSTTKAGDPPYAWLANFFYGHIDAESLKSSGYYVRAVCDVHTLPAGNRFVDNGDTVTDTVNGLEWQKATMDITGNETADAMNWKEALAATEKLTLAGKSDWRLPNINELRSLVDYGHYSPAIDPIFAAATKSSNYWSSTSDVYYTGRAGDVNFSTGYDDTYGDNKTNHFYVRAVRGEQRAVLLPPLLSKKNNITPVHLLLLKSN